MKVLGISNAVDYVDAAIYELGSQNSLTLIAREQTVEEVQRDNENAIVERITGTIKNVLDKSGHSYADISKVGIAMPGAISADGETVIRSSYFFPTLGVKPIPLAKNISTQIGGLPVKLVKDTNARLLAELRTGSAQGHHAVLYVLADIGIGGAIAANGELYLGGSNFAGEIGHVKVATTGDCNCGREGCVQATSSLGAIVSAITRRIGAGERSVLAAQVNSGNYIAPNDIDRATKKMNDFLATKVLSTAATNLGLAISNVANVLNPEVVILAGSLADTGYFFAEVEEATKLFTLRVIGQNLRFERARWGDEGELMGSALFAMEKS